jgi:hypothetical protein
MSGWPFVILMPVHGAGGLIVVEAGAVVRVVRGLEPLPEHAVNARNATELPSATIRFTHRSSATSANGEVAVRGPTVATTPFRKGGASTEPDTLGG